jgi:phosphoribosylamine--glycine ligase
MKILVVVPGREHALVWKISVKRVNKIYAQATRHGALAIWPHKPTSIISWPISPVREDRPDRGRAGAPLALGIVDEFNSRNLKIFGPNQKAAMIETSKSYAKEFMRKNNIPPPDFKVIHSANEAMDYFPRAQFPLVIKADGLAAGKGVYICRKKEDGEEAIKEIMLDGKFGGRGAVVIKT